MRNDQPPRPHGSLDLRIYRDGVLIEHSTGPNLVLTGAQAVEANLLGGNVAGQSITQVGYGAGGSAAMLGNTTLTLPVFVKNVDAISFPQPGVVAFTISLLAFEAVGYSISEFGLFTGNGTLYSRLVRAAPLLKDSSTTLNAVWSIDFTTED